MDKNQKTLDTQIQEIKDKRLITAITLSAVDKGRKPEKMIEDAMLLADKIFSFYQTSIDELESQKELEEDLPQEDPPKNTARWWSKIFGKKS